MDNRQIADRLDAFAALLELSDANPYTTRAYHRAAETIRGAPLKVEDLVRSGRVRELRGIGPGIEARLRELVETGESSYLNRLREGMPEGILELMRVPGLSVAKVQLIHSELGVQNLEDLEKTVESQ